MTATTTAQQEKTPAHLTPIRELSAEELVYHVEEAQAYYGLSLTATGLYLLAGLAALEHPFIEAKEIEASTSPRDLLTIWELTGRGLLVPALLEPTHGTGPDRLEKATRAYYLPLVNDPDRDDLEEAQQSTEPTPAI